MDENSANLNNKKEYIWVCSNHYCQGQISVKMTEKAYHDRTFFSPNLTCPVCAREAVPINSFDSNLLSQSPVVHLFSPGAHHDEQGIVGTTEGLRKLLLVIQTAIEKDTFDGTFQTSDGEGYDLFVRSVPPSEINKLALPYTEDYCKEDRKGVIYPWGSGA